MGKTIGHAVLWPAPPAAPHRTDSPSHSSQPGSEKSLVGQKRTRVPRPAVGYSSILPNLEEENSFPLTEDFAQGHSQDSTWPGTGPPPARITLRKGGAPGRGQELPAPAWARQHTGRNVPSSAGPPSACRLPHPGMAECNPGASGGCSAEAAVQRPPPPILTFLLCTKGSQGNPGVCKPGGQHLPQLPRKLTTPGLKGWYTMP